MSGSSSERIRTRSRKQKGNRRMELVWSWVIIILLLLAVVFSIFLAVHFFSGTEKHDIETVSEESSREVEPETIGGDRS